MKVVEDSSRVLRRIGFALSFLSVLAVTSLVYGAIPFYSIPTLSQILWTSGFAESFCNAGWPAIYAINFGIPDPAPISFGLSGAFLQSTLLHFFRLDAADAYAFGAVFWLALSLVGCIAFGRLLGLGRGLACLASLIYLTLPLVWAHATYSMISFAFALLPLYLCFGFSLMGYKSREKASVRRLSPLILSYFAVSFLAVFMDGYTYVMFFVVTGILFVVALVRRERPRMLLLTAIAPTILLSGGASYLSYVAYERGAPFTHAPISFFRSFGVDLAMLLIPSHGASWLLDFLHLSVTRDPYWNFGDASVWGTTFCAPLIVTGIAGCWLAKKSRFVVPLMLISLMGFYFSLGPSWKVNVSRPLVDSKLSSEWPLLAKELAPIPTGTAFFDRNVPGFNYMRAAYRWAALLFAGLFGLTILLVNELREGHPRLSICVIVGLVLINLPNLTERLPRSFGNRASMVRLNEDLKPLNDAIGEGRRVIFYPQRNDFLVNHLAALGKYYTFNIGGDKNMEVAALGYPSSVSELFATPFGPDFDQQIDQFLMSGDANCVAIPYFDLMRNARQWPPSEVGIFQIKTRDPEAASVSETREKFAPVLRRLTQNPKFDVKMDSLFALITSKNPPVPAPKRGLPLATTVSCQAGGKGVVYLRSGWSRPDGSGTWSDGYTSTMEIMPIGVDNEDLVLTISGLGYVTERHPFQSVVITVNSQVIDTLKYAVAGPVTNAVNVPGRLLKKENGILHIEFKFRDAISPEALGLSEDSRRLGVHLNSLSLSFKEREAVR